MFERTLLPPIKHCINLSVHLETKALLRQHIQALQFKWSIMHRTTVSTLVSWRPCELEPYFKLSLSSFGHSSRLLPDLQRYL